MTLHKQRTRVLRLLVAGMIALMAVMLTRPAEAVSFGSSTVPNHTFTVGEVLHLPLPLATGVVHVYSLSPYPNGTSVEITPPAAGSDQSGRALNGTPTRSQYEWQHTWSATSGEMADSVSFRMTILPAQPGGLSLSAASAASVGLSWSDPNDSGIQQWQYQQTTNRGQSWSSWTAIDASSADTTSHTVTGLDSEQGYGFRIRACADTSGAGCSVPSAPVGDVLAPAGNALVPLSTLTTGGGQPSIARSDVLALVDQPVQAEALRFPTWDPNDCLNLNSPRCGSLSAPVRFHAALEGSVSEYVHQRSLGMYTTNELGAASEWRYRFRSSGERLVHDEHGYEYVAGPLEPGQRAAEQTVFDLDLWVVFARTDRPEIRNVRLAQGPFAPEITVCLPQPHQLKFSYLASWDAVERVWNILDSVPSERAGQICALTASITEIVVLQASNPAAGLSSTALGEVVRWRAGQAVTASALLAAVPEADVIVIKLDGQDRVYSQLDLLPAFSDDFEIPPGAALTLVKLIG